MAITTTREIRLNNFHARAICMPHLSEISRVDIGTWISSCGRTVGTTVARQER